MSRVMTILIVVATFVALALSIAYRSESWITVFWAYCSIYFIGWVADKIEEEY